MNKLLLFYLFFLIGAIINFGEAGIKRKSTRELVTADQDLQKLLLTSVGMFSPKDAPSKSPPGNGESYVEMDFDFYPYASEPYDSVSIVLLHNLDIPKFGVLESDGSKNKTNVCCNQKYIDDGLCSEIGSVVLPNNSLSWVYPTAFDGQNEKNFNYRQNIQTSGLYHLYLVYCQPGKFYYSDSYVFMNPYGYLPGELWGFIPFYGVMMFVYLVVGIIWLIWCIKYWGQILPLQKYIGGVIFLGFWEMAIWLFDNLGYNGIGQNYVGAMIAGVLISTFKRTVSRFLVLAVALGYGVVKPTLGSHKRKILILGVLYFIFSAVEQTLELSQRTNMIPSLAITLIGAPRALLDTIFYWWIFYALLQTMRLLQTRRQTIKFEMYRNLFTVLIASGVVCSIVILAKIFVLVFDTLNRGWEATWWWDATWQLLYFGVLVGIAIIWRPTANNTRYAYQEVSIQDEEFSFNPVLANFSDVTLRKVEDVVVPLKEEKFSPNNQAQEKDIELTVPSFTVDDPDGKMD